MAVADFADESQRDMIIFGAEKSAAIRYFQMSGNPG
jgi:hypothetical protein